MKQQTANLYVQTLRSHYADEEGGINLEPFFLVCCNNYKVLFSLTKSELKLQLEAKSNKNITHGKTSTTTSTVTTTNNTSVAALAPQANATTATVPQPATTQSAADIALMVVSILDERERKKAQPHLLRTQQSGVKDQPSRDRRQERGNYQDHRNQDNRNPSRHQSRDRQQYQHHDSYRRQDYHRQSLRSRSGSPAMQMRSTSFAGGSNADIGSGSERSNHQSSKH